MGVMFYRVIILSNFSQGLIMFYLVSVLALFIISSTYMQFSAYVNILRWKYMEINEILAYYFKHKINVLTLKDLRKTDYLLKDFLNDICSIFSFNLFFCILQTFLTTTDGVYQFFSNETILLYFVSYIFNLSLIIILCTMAVDEVRSILKFVRMCELIFVIFRPGKWRFIFRVYLLKTTRRMFGKR